MIAIRIASISFTAAVFSLALGLAPAQADDAQGASGAGSPVAAAPAAPVNADESSPADAEQPAPRRARPILTPASTRRAVLSQREANRASGVASTTTSSVYCDRMSANACERHYSVCTGNPILLDVGIRNDQDTSTNAWKRRDIDLRWGGDSSKKGAWKKHKESARMFAYRDYSYGYPTAGRMVVRLTDGRSDLYVQASCWFGNGTSQEVDRAFGCALRTATAQLDAAVDALPSP
jgi:hypothetical protein